MRSLRVVELLALALLVVGPAQALVVGGGKDADKGNDCLIVMDGVDDADVTPKRRTNVITCTDCDPDCDLDGVATADGTCVFDLAVCLNQAGVEGCDPAVLKVAKASKKAVARGLEVPAVPLDDGATCSAFRQVPVETRRGGRKAGKLKVKLLAKNAERPRRKDKDVFLFVCEPRPEGEACPAATTTTTVTTTSTSTSLVLLPTGFTTTTIVLLPTGFTTTTFAILPTLTFTTTTTSTSTTIFLLPTGFTTTTFAILPTLTFTTTTTSTSTTIFLLPTGFTTTTLLLPGTITFTTTTTSTTIFLLPTGFTTTTLVILPTGTLLP